MARIAGVDLPREKKIEIGLTYIFGIGRKTAQKILEATGVSTAQRVRDLNDNDLNKLRQEIELPSFIRVNVAVAGTGTMTADLEAFIG